MRRGTAATQGLVLFVLLLLLLAGCTPPPAPTAAPTPARDRLLAESTILEASRASAPASGRPVRFPEDDAPHANLTEWWYYTGHLEGAGGQRYGMEFVIFQSTLGAVTVGYASHFAITDLQRQRFSYAERVAGRPTPSIPATLDLDVAGWTLQGGAGRDRLQASMDDYSLALEVVATKPPALHDGDGIISLGASGDSYYYSRTRMAARGTLLDHGTAVPVTGEVWMDHQWGDFLVIGGGGWDWFSAQLDDGSEIATSLVRDAEGGLQLRYGLVVRPDGSTLQLSADQVAVEATGTWRSPHTGILWPSGWRLTAPTQGIDLRMTPMLADQELDTSRSTGVIYWEGAVTVDGASGGRPVAGRGYVELTGYRP